MNAPPDVSVVIPVYNELDGVDRCFAEVEAAMAASGLSWELIFVDDGSTDGSTEKLCSLAAAHDHVLTIVLTRNHGQQPALLEGLRASSGRCVATFDADLQFAPGCLGPLARKVLDGFDIAGGIRASRRDSLWRNRIPSLVGRWLINTSLGIRQVDFGAVKAYSRRLVDDLLSLPAEGLIIPAAAYHATRNFIEVPVEHRPRFAGSSKWSLFRRVEIYWDIYVAYGRRPFQWVMVTGAASLAAGLVLSAGTALYRVFVGGAFSGLIIFFDVFLIVFGLHFLTLSQIGEFSVRTFRRGRLSRAVTVARTVGGAGRQRRRAGS